METDILKMKNFAMKYILSCWLFTLAVLVVVSLSPSLGWAGDAKSDSANVQDLKAVYLYNFLNFVHWPEDGRLSLVGDTPHKKIAVVGACPTCRDALRRLQAKLAESSRPPISVTFHGSFREGMDLRDCNLLYICDSEKGQWAEILKSLGDAPVLTVADGESFLAVGGMVALVSYGKTMRWSINRSSLVRADLRMSAKLFDIAINVINDHNSSMDRYYRWLARLDVVPGEEGNRWGACEVGCA